MSPRHTHHRTLESNSSATSQNRRRVYQETQTPQPDTGPISQEQLVAQVKTIHAGLVMVEEKCNEVDRQMGSAAPPEPNQYWQADVDVIDGPIIGNGFKDPAAFLYSEGAPLGEVGSQATFDTDIDGMTSPTVPCPASANTYQPSSDTWSLRTTCHQADSSSDGITYDSYGQRRDTQWAGGAFSDCPATASCSGIVQDEQAEVPQYAGRVYDYTLERWVYEDVTLEVPVCYRDEKDATIEC
ncbi:hypothetical protein CJF31_00012006 [Rutstroemia sp. NJR-2017a BVV2]|nr:hypothetical protein CJF31_00012006 [Rutstroemia sp. NJR-2017a BVV2]